MVRAGHRNLEPHVIVVQLDERDRDRIRAVQIVQEMRNPDDESTLQPG